MEKTALEHVENKIREEVAKRFPDAPVERVSLLQYGDDPVIEPGDLLVRIVLTAPDGDDEREQVLDAFHQGNREAVHKFRDDLTARLPEATTLEFCASPDGRHGPKMKLGRPGRRSLEARANSGADLTPVMARLAPAELETLDTLITAGIAPNRAEAVRWALARIRERPAYEQLLARKREIEELKAQF
jgi:hypothetical protein